MRIINFVEIKLRYCYLFLKEKFTYKRLIETLVMS
jgi:hypothetical protein